ncbi:PHB depolymerase family esterase [Rossellomorea aquimaris]|uniref:extracellular catalytic domain type 1 short-chain-length polyhydroxyalkanoate depolymerase n=1 Tax=Rossellomorea aquimaris TaxID=189382 RepID=UPI0021CC6794|nr:PHB depolymerase family esterase [Rossellomorea aquimaris]
MLKGKQVWVTVVTLMLLGASTLFPGPSSAAGQFLNGSYGGKPYKLYIPEQYDSSRSYPLYVMLHGCTQDASQFSTGTKMNTLADEKGFLVLYPEQTSSSNSNKCWNWFEAAHQSRGSGEPAIIAGMVNSIKNDYSIQSEKIYAAGLSAGAAMSVILGATYPDIFSGIGVGSGLEYKAATSMTGAFTAMSSGGPNPGTQGRLAYQAMGSGASTLPVIVFHGTSDYTVSPVNGDQVITQWSVTNDLAQNGSEDGWMDDQPDRTENGTVSGGRSYSVNDYEGGDGKVWMKMVKVQSMGHAWSGGSSQGSYTDPQGPDASRMMWEFFDSFSDDIGGGDETALVTTATPKGGTYSQPIEVELVTNQDADTYYTTDGSNPTVQSTLYSNPIQITDDTTLTFFSQDSSGQKEAIKQEVYVINEGAPDDRVTINSIPEEDGFSGKFLADGKGTGDIKIGDKGMYNTDTFRGILSFDTSVIEQMTVESATIRLYTKSLTGTVPSITMDIKSGTFGSAAIESSDYSASPSLTNITSFQPPATSSYIDVEIPAATISQLNKNGKTQFRLKAVTVAGFTANQVEFYGGGNGGTSPTLIINGAN